MLRDTENRFKAQALVIISVTGTLGVLVKAKRKGIIKGVRLLWLEMRQNGSHKVFENKETGKIAVVPFHCKDLKKGTEQNILKQAGLK